MRLISFDIGIKNMAYCILSTDASNIDILDWNVLNLMDSEQPKRICNCIIPPKSKKHQPKPCMKVAKFMKNTNYYCEKHAKSNTQYFMPAKQTSMASLKKLKLEELLRIGISHSLFINIENFTKLNKSKILDIVSNFYEKKNLEPIIFKKSKTAGDTDLIKIGKNMKELLNNITGIDEITHVVIENQISPIANRMKTIQGMLAQYFIMKNSDIEIEFVSSANKLKQFEKKKIENIIKEKDQKNDYIENILIETEKPIENKIKLVTTNPNYKEHKKDGVFYCSQILEINSCFHNWKNALDTKKKDDLADSFLQGIWYLKNRHPSKINILLNADDLKINSVLLS
uniref:Mitochondrial resolvase Ydc2 catalytic domain-containing protein n=1 Tax=viral metagenome TaxID=1070528 RepID=A0A6C0EAQ9_9ZZZZ